MSERIYIPLEAFQKTFGRGENISLITVAPKAGIDGFKLEKQVLQLLRERHPEADGYLRGEAGYRLFADREPLMEKLRTRIRHNRERLRAASGLEPTPPTA